MRLSAITAIAQNNIIGKDNSLPWHLPADMKFFKKTTMGHPIIMGRKTYESFKKALPGRTNIVITRQKDYTLTDAIVVHSLKAAIEEAKAIEKEETFILGGAEIFKLSLPLIQRIYITRIYEEFEGDVEFPSFEVKDWEMIGIEPHEPDKKNKYYYAFQLWERKE